MRKILSLFCLALLFPLVSCNDYTIPEDAYYPLKIGVLVPTDTAPAADESTLEYIQPGETLVMRSSCSFNGQDLVNLNLEFTVHDGYCIVTSEDEDIQSAAWRVPCRFIMRFSAIGAR